MMRSMLLFLILSFSMAQDCNNPLIDVFGFTETLTTPASSSFNYCKSLKGRSVCCKKSTINEFQKKTNELVSDLKEMAKKRDSYFMETLNELKPQYLSLNKKFNDTISAALTKVQATSPSQYLKLLSIVNLVAPKALKFEQMTDKFRTILVSYQKARQTCITRMIRIQAAAWCLACDPNYSTQQGVGTGGSVTLDSRVCNRVKRGCYEYMYYSGQMSLILEVNVLLNIYTSLVDHLADIASTGTVPPIDLTSSFVFTDDSQRPTFIPSTCVEDSYCDWLCKNLLNPENATINEALVGNGGSPFASDDLFENEFYSRLLLEINSTFNESSQHRNLRMLSTITWTTADDDEAGVRINFPEDPANLVAKDGKILFDKVSILLLLLILFFVLN